MAKIITINSFRGGTGKSTITSNLAVYLASLGNKVLILDTDIRSPGIHALFGLEEGNLEYTFNEYLTGEARIEEAVYDLTDTIKLKNGELYLTPSSISYGDIANTLVSKYSYKMIKKAFESLIEAYDLDYLIVDTHPGLNEECLLSAELSDAFILIVRPDNQDYQGAKVSTEVASKLGINTYLVLNKVYKKINVKKLTKDLEGIFGFPVVAAIPFSEDIMTEESRSIFFKKHPKHAFSKAIKEILSEIIKRKPSSILKKK